jgi:hypothetical protein
MKQTLVYGQQSCRLQLEGLPDVSAGQVGDALGIITSWTLDWPGRPELEGRREHLVALINVVLPYARYLMSGVARPFGEPDQPIEIAPAAPGDHRLRLRSSEPGVEPLEVHLDDAELADLVRVLDAVRLDPRLHLQPPLSEPLVQPLRRRELLQAEPLARRLAAPVVGLAALALTAGLSALAPLPAPVPWRTDKEPPASKAPPPSAGPAGLPPQSSAIPPSDPGTDATKAAPGSPQTTGPSGLPSIPPGAATPASGLAPANPAANTRSTADPFAPAGRPSAGSAPPLRRLFPATPPPAPVARP